MVFGYKIFDVLIAFMVLSSSILAFTATIALIRFPDTLTRMHAANKPQVLGLVLMIFALIASTGLKSFHASLLLAVIFTILTNPAVGHRVGRIAYYEQVLKDPEENPESPND